MALTLCQKWLIIFEKKLKILYSSDHTILFNFHKHVVQCLLNNVWEDFRFQMSAPAIVI